MTPKRILTVAVALGASVACIRPAAAQPADQVPALYRGEATCVTKYPGSFLDVGKGSCWKCPAQHNRTVFSVTAGNACHRPAYEKFKKAVGPENPTGLLRTDCRKGWFLHLGKGCYSCGGWNRSAHPIDHERACSTVEVEKWTTATHVGPDACPAGSFRHGLTTKCYACPADYGRNLVIADDLTKVNACTKSSSSVHNATEAKFAGAKDSQRGSQSYLGGLSGGVTTYDPKQAAFDLMARALMQAAIDGELLYKNGFDAISLMSSVSIATVLGYTHAFGYVMTKSSGAAVCKKTWSNAFTGGVSAGAGVVVEIGLSKGVKDGGSETNGWQVSASYPPVAGGWGLHWSSDKGELTSSTYTFGPGIALEVGFSEYTHIWSETGKVVPCNKMTWGSGWAAL